MLAEILRSQRTAFVVISILIGCAVTFGYQLYGWLGVAFVGLVGLIISLRAEIFEHYGDPHERNSGYVVSVYARQLRNRDHDGPEGQLRRQSEAAARHQIHRVLNAVLGAIMLLGAGMTLSRFL